MATRPIATTRQVRKNPAASFVREDLKKFTRLYEVVDDALAGSVTVKARGSKYLPIPNPVDASKENLARYDAYKTRAVFYAVTRRALEGFTGEIFDKDPTITVPPALKVVIEDATGEGVGLVQVAKKCVKRVLSKGRAGLFVDYPNTAGATTRADVDEKTVQPIIRAYEPQKVINWRHKQVGAKRFLSLVVLEEEYEKETDGFTSSKGKQWRVLRLDDAGYNVALYRDTSGDNAVDEDGNVIGVVYPTDANGDVFREIPFKFIGAGDNDAEIDYPPMFDIADLNMAHYRNSADYEEAVYIVGQPTPVISGLTETWADKYFKDGIGLGSRAALPLPVGASAELLQVTETAMAKEAMEQKERQMVALGAKLVEQKTVQRTATEAGQEAAAEKSVLSNVADNVSVAMEWALYYAARFAGVAADGEGKIVFRLNKEFSISFASPEATKGAIEAWVAEAISYTEMRAALRNGGLARLPDKQAKEEIAADEAAGQGPINQKNLNDQQNGFDQNDENNNNNNGNGNDGTESVDE